MIYAVYTVACANVGLCYLTLKKVAYYLIVRCTIASLQRVGPTVWFACCLLIRFLDVEGGTKIMDDLMHCNYRPNYSEIGHDTSGKGCPYAKFFFDWTYVRPPV